jgi:hypothetical protein
MFVGYIRVRDYVVANCRSQLSGAFEYSDYYSPLNNLPQADTSRGVSRFQVNGEPRWEGKRIVNIQETACGTQHR